MRCIVASHLKGASLSLALLSGSMTHGRTLYANEKKRISFQEIICYLSILTSDLSKYAVACAILAIPSGFEPSSAPGYLKLVTAPSFCP